MRGPERHRCHRIFAAKNLAFAQDHFAVLGDNANCLQSTCFLLRYKLSDLKVYIFHQNFSNLYFILRQHTVFEGIDKTKKTKSNFSWFFQIFYQIFCFSNSPEEATFPFLNYCQVSLSLSLSFTLSHTFSLFLSLPVCNPIPLSHLFISTFLSFCVVFFEEDWNGIFYYDLY